MKTRNYKPTILKPNEIEEQEKEPGKPQAHQETINNSTKEIKNSETSETDALKAINPSEKIGADLEKRIHHKLDALDKEYKAKVKEIIKARLSAV